MKFYKITSFIDELGIRLLCSTYESVHETNCYYFCINSLDESRFDFHSKNNKDNLSTLELCKKHFLKIRKVAKINSRFAFKTRAEAFAHFKMLKNKQLAHIERKKGEISLTVELIKNIDAFSEAEGVREEFYGDRSVLLNGSIDFVRSNYTFD